MEPAIVLARYAKAPGGQTFGENGLFVLDAMVHALRSVIYAKVTVIENAPDLQPVGHVMD